MAAENNNKYLDLDGLAYFKDKLEEEINAGDNTRIPKTGGTANDPTFLKVGLDEYGLAKNNVAVTKADITALGIPAQDNNQMIKGNGATFGVNAVVNIKGGSNITVTANTTTNEITIAGSANDNQTVKANGETFGLNAAVDLKSGNKITLTKGTDAITFDHATYPAATAAAVKVGSDQYGHVVLGDALAKVASSGSYTDLINKPTIGNGTLTIKVGPTTASLSSKGTFTANQASSTNIEITAEDLGLTGAMHFKGVVDTLPAVTSYAEGDVIIVKGDGKEYVCATVSGTKKWVELGDESSHALKSITVTGANGLTGGGDLSQNRVISHATYSAANAAAIKVGRDQYGHVVTGDALTIGSGGAHDHSISATVSIPTITPTTATLSINTGTTAVVTGYNPTVQKLVTTKITGTDGIINASKINNITVLMGHADVGSAVRYGTANVASSSTTIGNANVSSTPKYFIKDFKVSGVVKNAYTADYDANNSELILTPLELTTDSVMEAVVSSNHIYGAVAAPDTQTLTPAKAATVKLNSYFDNVTPAKAATASITVATGSITSAGTGSDVITGLGTPTTVAVLASATASVTSVVTKVTTDTTPTAVTGTAIAVNGHTHPIG